MNNPLVSIVVCTYNRCFFLKKTMESIFKQQYEPVEIIIIDDGSTDNTQELISSYSDKVRYSRQENRGIAAARTAGCQLAKGEYIAFQDDDDIMPPYRIVRLYETLKKYPSAVLAFGDWTFIDNKGELTGERSRFPLLKDYNEEIKEPLLIEDGYTAIMWTKVIPGPPATLFSRLDGERIEWFDSRFFHSYEDMDFFARLGQLGPIIYLPEIVCYYRKGHSSLTVQSLHAAYCEFLFIEKHLLAVKAHPKKLKKRLQYRMLWVLQKISFLQRNEIKLPNSFHDDYLRRGISLLNIRRRFDYWWYASIRPPIRKFILDLSKGAWPLTMG